MMKKLLPEHGVQDEEDEEALTWNMVRMMKRREKLTRNMMYKMKRKQSPGTWCRG